MIIIHFIYFCKKGAYIQWTLHNEATFSYILIVWVEILANTDPAASCSFYHKLLNLRKCFAHFLDWPLSEVKPLF